MKIEKITYSALLERKARIDLMRIRSFDPEMYIIEMEFDNGVYLITDDKGETLQFRGQQAAKKPFETLHITSAVLAHQSAYDEMVGQPPSNNKMEMPTSVPGRNPAV